MSLHAWLTPDTIPTTELCRALFIPDDIALIAAVSGALLPLADAENWELYGAKTPQETADAMFSMLEAFWSGGCNPVTQVDRFSHWETQGTNGGGILANTDTRVPFNTWDVAGAANVSFSGTNIFSVEPGKYLIHVMHIFHTASNFNVAFWAVNEAGYPAWSEQLLTTAQVASGRLLLSGLALLNAAARIKIGFWARCNIALANTAFGTAINMAGHHESYGHVSFTRYADA